MSIIIHGLLSSGLGINAFRKKKMNALQFQLQQFIMSNNLDHQVYKYNKKNAKKFNSALLWSY